jgi:hypothetical protein
LKSYSLFSLSPQRVACQSRHQDISATGFREVSPFKAFQVTGHTHSLNNAAIVISGVDFIFYRQIGVLQSELPGINPFIPWQKFIYGEFSVFSHLMFYT